MLFSSSAQHQNWNPHHCHIHKYTPSEVYECLKGSRVLMLGDLELEQLYNSLLHNLQSGGSEFIQTSAGNVRCFRSSSQRESEGAPLSDLELIFISDPFLNSSAFVDEVRRGIGRDEGKKLETPTSIVLLGASKASVLAAIPQPAKVSNQNGLAWFLDQLLLASKGKYTAVMADEIIVRPIASLQEIDMLPEVKSIAPKGADDLEFLEYLNRQLDAFVSSQSLGKDSTGIFSKGAGFPLAGPMHVHFPLAVPSIHKGQTMGSAASVELNIIMNHYCNRRMSSPSDGQQKSNILTTCCNRYLATSSSKQIALVGGLLGSGLFCVVKSAFGVFKASGSTSKFVLNAPVLEATTKLLFVTRYLFFTDRTGVYMKTALPAPSDHVVQVIVALICAALASIRFSPSDPTIFLESEKLNEWKGLMMIVVFLKLYSGGLNQEWDVIVQTSFGFISGWSHYSYFKKSGDLSFERAARVLLRINLACIFFWVTIDSPHTLHQSLQSAIAAFFIVWLISRLTLHRKIETKHAKSLKFAKQRYPRLIRLFAVSLVCSLLAGTILYVRHAQAVAALSDGAPDEQAFNGGHKFMFNINSWQLLRHLGLSYLVSVIAGISMAHLSEYIKAFALRSTNVPIFPPASPTSTRFTVRTDRGRRIGATLNQCVMILSLVSVFLSLTAASFFNVTVPVWIPVLGFTVLRYGTYPLNRVHSGLLSHLGKYSAEATLIAPHALFAMDGKAALVVVPGHWGCNLVVVGIVFLVMCEMLHRSSREMADWIVIRLSGRGATFLVIALGIAMVLWW
ncbi:10 TM acyl transferase domain found in Cas1p-domain-containing protein [Cladochytrium replicatum]|nr:10 TM acyl transferase domain found in Cas1p-domain-containing protein [Cladochytrium replicatum]